MKREEKEQIIIAIIIFILIGIGVYRFYGINKIDKNAEKESGEKTEIIRLENIAGEKTEDKKEIKFKPVRLININEASLKELQKLPEIGEKLAERIISCRNDNGKFSRKEDIMKVKGIGEKKYERIKDFISVK